MTQYFAQSSGPWASCGWNDQWDGSGNSPYQNGNGDNLPDFGDGAEANGYNVDVTGVNAYGVSCSNGYGGILTSSQWWAQASGGLTAILWTSCSGGSGNGVTGSDIGRGSGGPGSANSTGLDMHDNGYYVDIADVNLTGYTLTTDGGGIFWSTVWYARADGRATALTWYTTTAGTNGRSMSGVSSLAYLASMPGAPSSHLDSNGHTVSWIGLVSIAPICPAAFIAGIQALDGSGWVEVIFPTASQVASGVDRGDGTAGTMSFGIPTGSIVDPAYVVVGHNNYTGGSAGTYPTSATTAASQLATDEAAVTAAAAGITTATTILGVTGTLDMSTYVLKSNVVSAAYVVTGNNNYVGGSAGSYPTSATTAASQLATDEAAVTAAAAGITTATTILGVTGTLDMSTYVLKSNVVSAAYVVTGNNNYVGGSAGSYPTSATTAASQLATDAAAVTAAKASIVNTVTLLGVTGTLDLTVYVEIADVVLPSNVLIGIPCYTGGPVGTAGIQNSLTQSQVASLLASYGIVTPPAIALVPVAPNGDITLRQGLDYCTLLGNELVIDASDWPSLVHAAVTLSLTLVSSGAVELTPLAGTVQNAGSSTQSVVFALTHAQTAALPAGLGSGYTHTYVTEATWTSGANLGLVWAPPQGNARVTPP